MRFYLLAPALSVLLVYSPSSANAGLNLGMKLACKRYGDAWDSGDRSALYQCTSSAFGRMLSRIPQEAFVRLPRGGKSRVLGSRKSRGRGTVTVATNQGNLTFILAGRGMRWTVTDIYKPGDDGRVVSLKNYLDASLTASEFICDLKYHGGDSFYDSITPDFRASFERLTSSEMNRVRRFLPEIDRSIRPYVTMGGSQATMRVPVPGGGPNDYAVFKLVHRGGWKVNDYTIDASNATIASFKKGLPLIACASAFGEFVKNPTTGGDPTSFVTAGVLRTELEWVKSQGSFPLPVSDQRDNFVIAGDCRCVTISYPGRQIRLHVAEERGQCKIEKISVCMGESWNDVAPLLALKRQMSSFSLVSSLQRMFQRDEVQSADNADDSVLENAVHREVTTSKDAAVAERIVKVNKPAAPRTPNVDPAVKNAAASTASANDEKCVKLASYREARPTTVYYVQPKHRRRKLSKSWRRRWFRKR